MTYLLADTVTGVWEVPELEGEECEVLTQHEFLEALDGLKDSELIGCKAGCEYYAKIDAAYFIYSIND